VFDFLYSIYHVILIFGLGVLVFVLGKGNMELSQEKGWLVSRYINSREKDYVLKTKRL
jgi:hypothetical protein